MIMRKKLTFCVAVALMPQVWASGYNFGTQSVSSMSTADASAAEALDPSVIYYNPAGLTHLPSLQISANLIIADPTVHYKNAAGYNVDRSPILGSTSGNVTKNITLVPHAYLSYQISPSITAGLGLYVPFGANTKYQEDSVLRYSINRTELKTIDINPTIAFKISPEHSIGIGLIAQYADAKLHKYANFSPAVNQKLPPQMQLSNGAADGVAKFGADDWGFGFNLGWDWDVNENLRVGASYRSPIKHHLTGTANWDLVGPAFKNPALGAALEQGIRQAGYVKKEKASANITTPESISVHGMYRIDPKINLFGNVTWTRHSRFNELDIKLENIKPTIGGPSDTSRAFPRWRDTWRIGVGGSYQITDPLQLRAGVSWDQSPIKSADDRLVTMPDNDRLWLSLGAKYDINKNSTLDVGYSYMHVRNSKANVHPCPGACVDSKASGKADFKSHANFFGLQYTYRF
ncbi:OmpP1/FadL family transporter [Suttonella ornithocola]|uniref:Outer membrane protein NMB0088 n=1 Tax=Suttonella ornithocola TaxID=279832 RepID=A0A380ML74_9GAMM|nr:OmpP1/FadL family transporter [Suttonella ornithocola]SUO93395.1 Putative outer membrane protein NMB0088 precursor [Suttonella ornithocola]